MKQKLIKLIFGSLNLRQFICAVGWGLYCAVAISAQEKITLDFKAVNIQQALQVLAKQLPLNLVVSEQVQGNISLHLTDVAPEEALHAILKAQGLTHERQGSTYIIGPQQEKNESDTHSLTTKCIVVKHRAAKEVATIFLKSVSQKTPKSTLNIDEASNSLWIRDTSQRIKELEQLVSAFDKQAEQVSIKARIVSLNRNFERSLGMKLGLKSIAAPIDAAHKNEDNISNEESFLMPEMTTDFSNIKNHFQQMLPIVWRGFTKILDLELAAMENQGHARIISSPHLITLDKARAHIEAGSELPYQEKGRYGTSIAFKKAVLSLQVVPEITPSGYILLSLEVNHDKPGALGVEKTPAIDTQKLKTQVLVRSGETVALGGIYEIIEQKATYRVPGLASIPWVGRVFRQESGTHMTRELMVFITPQLVSESLLATDRNHPFASL